MYYEPVWEYQGHKLVKRPGTSNYSITWYRSGSGRGKKKTTGTDDLELAKEKLIDFVRARTCVPGPAT